MIPNPLFPWLVLMGWTTAYFANLEKLFSPPEPSQIGEERGND